MTYLLWALGLLLVLGVVAIAIAGKRKWDAYTKLARLRPQEHIVHEEKNVRVKTKAWAWLPPFDWTYAGGGILEYGWLTADVTITDERVLSFSRGVPVGIIDFTRQESLPIPWLPFRRESLINVSKDDVCITSDQSGTPCLEVQYAGRKGHGLRMRYYLRDLDSAKALFTERESSSVEG